MKCTKIAGEAGAETRIVILDSGEEAFATLTKFANDAGLTAASLAAIGAFEKATIGWFDFDKKTYKKIEVGQQCEVLRPIGDVAATTAIGRVLSIADGLQFATGLWRASVFWPHERAAWVHVVTRHVSRRFEKPNRGSDHF
jgi:predicted DNA-binding protein with PD1-like motif